MDEHAETDAETPAEGCPADVATSTNDRLHVLYSIV
jgi:hypothetical protein